MDSVEAAAYRIPTDRPEADGTYEWQATTLVTCHVTAGETGGFGYSYGSEAMVPIIRRQLAPCVIGVDACAVELAWQAMVREVRNIGRPGVAATAISAVDAALWDLKARLLDLPLVRLLGAVRTAVPVYGSGGFTSDSIHALAAQLAGWAGEGIGRVKMKVGSHPEDDARRVRAARSAVGSEVILMVDANGAYRRKEALRMAEAFAELGVTWFEEPVVADDLEGLRLMRDRAPAGVEIAAGEYGFELPYFRRMIEASAVDVLQADATRCLGITGFLAVARLCQAVSIPLSAHTAPSLHAAPGCAAAPVVHIEYFHDHVRIERLLFDGFVAPEDGCIAPDRSRPGHGLTFKELDARRYAVP